MYMFDTQANLQTYVECEVLNVFINSAMFRKVFD